MSGGSNFWNLQPKNLYTAWWGDRLVRLDVNQCTVQGEEAFSDHHSRQRHA